MRFVKLPSAVKPGTFNYIDPRMVAAVLPHYERDDVCEVVLDCAPGTGFKIALAPAAVVALLSGEPVEEPAPVAPPALEPRRTVGAVVRAEIYEYAVILGGEGRCQRPLEDDASGKADWQTESQDTFVRWMTREECERHGIPYVARPLPGAPLAAPSPAATPAAKPWTWRAKPEVGDVWVHPLAPETQVIITNSGGGLTLSAGKNFPEGDFTGVGPASSDGAFGWYYLRPATSSERAAAGLPVDESATKPVDRVALAKALREAFHKETYGCAPDAWDDCTETGKRGYLAEADAAIAFMAKGGA